MVNDSTLRQRIRMSSLSSDANSLMRGIHPRLGLSSGNLNASRVLLTKEVPRVDMSLKQSPLNWQPVLGRSAIRRASSRQFPPRSCCHRLIRASTNRRTYGSIVQPSMKRSLQYASIWLCRGVGVEDVAFRTELRTTQRVSTVIKEGPEAIDRTDR